MALQSIAELLINTQRTPGQVLLRSLVDYTPYVPIWIEDDKFTIRLRFAAPPVGSGPATPLQLEADNVITLSARKVRGVGAALFTAQVFTQVISGGDIYYQSRLNLHTAPMLAAFGSDTTALVWIDVGIQAPDPEGGADPDRFTYQFPVLVNRQAYAGDAPVASGDPIYPAPGLLVQISGAAGYRFIGGYLQLRDTVTGGWRGLFLESGALSLTAESPPLAAPAFWRIAGNYIQLKDTVTGGWRSIFLAGGALALGNEESV